MTTLQDKQHHAREIMQLSQKLARSLKDCDYEKTEQLFEQGALFDFAQLFLPPDIQNNILTSHIQTASDKQEALAWFDLLIDQIKVNETFSIGNTVLTKVPERFDILISKGYQIKAEDYINSINKEFSHFQKLDQIQSWKNVSFEYKRNDDDILNDEDFGLIDDEFVSFEDHPLNLLSHLKTPSLLTYFLKDELVLTQLRRQNQEYLTGLLELYKKTYHSDQMFVVLLEHDVPLKETPLELLEKSLFVSDIKTNAIWHMYPELRWKQTTDFQYKDRFTLELDTEEKQRHQTMLQMDESRDQEQQLQQTTAVIEKKANRMRL